MMQAPMLESPGLSGMLPLLLLLLLLLLASFYLCPYQIPGLPQHVYHVLLARGIELHVSLHLPDTIRGLPQRLQGVLLCLLLVAFCHHNSLSYNY
jgi:hypothetical protein